MHRNHDNKTRELEASLATLRKLRTSLADRQPDLPPEPRSPRALVRAVRDWIELDKAADQLARREASMTRELEQLRQKSR